MTRKKQEMRVCRLCGEKKTVDKFEIDRRVKGGRTSRCKACKFNSNSKAAKAHRRLYERQDKYPIPVEITRRDFEIFHDMFSDVCIYCFKDLSFETATFDHIIPLGHPETSNRPENIHICCRSCNASKGNKPLFAFYNDSKNVKNESLEIVLKHVAYFSKRSVEEVREQFQRHYDEYLAEKTKNGEDELSS